MDYLRWIPFLLSAVTLYIADRIIKEERKETSKHIRQLHEIIQKQTKDIIEYKETILRYQEMEEK